MYKRRYLQADAVRAHDNLVLEVLQAPREFQICCFKTYQDAYVFDSYIEETYALGDPISRYWSSEFYIGILYTYNNWH